LLHILAFVALTFSSHKPDLHKTLEIWQQKLQLTQWNITLEMVADHALGGVSMGDVQWDFTAKKAFIRVLREEDYDLPVQMARLDQQATVVHELVHILHAGHPADKSAEEASVVQETNSLLRANHAWRILAVQDY
jgi:hypothetical protein